MHEDFSLPALNESSTDVLHSSFSWVLAPLYTCQRKVPWIQTLRLCYLNCKGLKFNIW